MSFFCRRAVAAASRKSLREIERKSQVTEGSQPRVRRRALRRTALRPNRCYYLNCQGRDLRQGPWREFSAATSATVTRDSVVSCTFNATSPSGAVNGFSSSSPSFQRSIVSSFRSRSERAGAHVWGFPGGAPIPCHTEAPCPVRQGPAWGFPDPPPIPGHSGGPRPCTAGVCRVRQGLPCTAGSAVYGRGLPCTAGV